MYEVTWKNVQWQLLALNLAAGTMAAFTEGDVVIELLSLTTTCHVLSLAAAH